jgi:hypothetical protein
MTVNIRQIDSKSDRKKFVKMPWLVYKNDPHWIPPLLLERLETISKKKNPFFEHGEAALFLAERDGVAIGRITAHTNRLHNEYHKDKAGFFGFFESINEQAVADALLRTAEGWLKAKGCDNVLGPESFSTNEEVGLLIKGFDLPIMLFCPYNPPFYQELIEKSGYQKAKDLYGWHYTVGDIPEAPRQLAEAVEKHPGLKMRVLDRKNFKRDVMILRDIFNTSWNKNWGYVPWTDREAAYSASMLKLIVKEDLIVVAELNGEPIGISICVPNLMEIFDGLNGRLLPFGIFKLLYRLKFHKYEQARLLLLGIRPEHRRNLGGLSVLLYVNTHKGGIKLGIKTAELSWTLEDNERINTGITFMGGTVGKVYRVFGKNL